MLDKVPGQEEWKVQNLMSLALAQVRAQAKTPEQPHRRPRAPSMLPLSLGDGAGALTGGAHTGPDRA